MSVNFQQYLDLIKAKYTEAEERRDHDEAIRLLALLQDTCGDQIQKLRKHQADERGRNT